MILTRKAIATAAEKIQSGKFPSSLEGTLAYIEGLELLVTNLETRVSAIESLARGQIKQLPPATPVAPAGSAPPAPVAAPVVAPPVETPAAPVETAVDTQA